MLHTIYLEASWVQDSKTEFSATELGQFFLPNRAHL